MRQLSSEIEINATAEHVWQILTDFPALKDWNPFIPSIEGEPLADEKLRVRIEPPGGMGMSFSPTVLKAEPGVELRWIGRVLMPGLFDGEHSFTIEQLGNGRVRFVQREKFTGVLVPLMGLMGVYKSTAAGFAAMNQALKERAERPEG